MADARLDTRQLSEILLMLDQIVNGYDGKFTTRWRPDAEAPRPRQRYQLAVLNGRSRQHATSNARVPVAALDY